MGAFEMKWTKFSEEQMVSRRTWPCGASRGNDWSARFGVNAAPVDAHQEWALDLVANGIASGRGIRILTMVDEFTRECPAIEVEVSLGSQSRYQSAGTSDR